METEEVQPPLQPHPYASVPPVPVQTTAGPPTQHNLRRPAPPRRSPRTKRVAVCLVGLLVVVACTVLSALNYHRLQRAEASTTAIRTELHRALAGIAVARSELALAQQQSGAAAAALSAASNHLGQVQARLAAAQANLRVGGVNIATLDSCLSGVNQALNEVALGDQAGAAGILQQHTQDCQAAAPS
jgi:hypothetical protein